MNDPTPLITLQEAAKYLQISNMTLYRLAKKKQIPAIRVGGRWRFKKEMIDAWMKKGSLKK